MLRSAHVGFWCLALVLLAAAGSRAAETAADGPPAAKAAPAEKGEAKPESPAAGSRPERPMVRMAPEGAPRLMRGPADAAKAPTDILPARFEATVYEVQVSADRAGKLDSAALSAKAADADDLRKALAEFGPTKILYRVDQPVNVFSENIMIGSSEPVVTATRKTVTGESVNTVQYQQVGLIINISASQPPKDSGRKGLDVQMRTEVASLGEDAPEILPGVKGVRARTVSINHSATLQYGRPSVMLNVTYPTKDEKASATAFVMRSVFSEVKP